MFTRVLGCKRRDQGVTLIKEVGITKLEYTYNN